MFKALGQFWLSVMDERVNPLRHLNPMTKYQLMMVLATMWSFIFCAMFGIWEFMPEYVIGHYLLLTVGILVTANTFHNATKLSNRFTGSGHRDILKSSDGKGVNHDDVWGG